MNESDDLFDAIEELGRAHERAAADEGTLVAKRQHFKTGFTLGWQQASHVLQEIGKIDGLLSTILLNDEVTLDRRTKSNIAKIQQIISEYPNWKPEENFIETKLATIFTKTKFVLQKLNISAKVIDRSVDADF